MMCPAGVACLPRRVARDRGERVSQRWGGRRRGARDPRVGPDPGRRVPAEPGVGGPPAGASRDRRSDGRDDGGVGLGGGGRHRRRSARLRSGHGPRRTCRHRRAAIDHPKHTPRPAGPCAACCPGSGRACAACCPCRPPSPRGLFRCPRRAPRLRFALSRGRVPRGRPDPPVTSRPLRRHPGSPSDRRRPLSRHPRCPPRPIDRGPTSRITTAGRCRARSRAPR